MDAWKDILNDKGRSFFCQLWCVGRVSHTSYQPSDASPISSTNQVIINIKGYL
uniref:Uncharacterized protein n=1 Tax=Physcomitrium patens TaxID=3218 RepID=A0A7I4FSS3_PHYPA